MEKNILKNFSFLLLTINPFYLKYMQETLKKRFTKTQWKSPQRSGYMSYFFIILCISTCTVSQLLWYGTDSTLQFISMTPLRSTFYPIQLSGTNLQTDILSKSIIFRQLQTRKNNHINKCYWSRLWSLSCVYLSICKMYVKQKKPAACVNCRNYGYNLLTSCCSK